ncbi:MAG: DUF3341 domain-containing protein [Candidatus Eremiobacteraeota bacterium]|nr:DUF3341 domain-containing protein [Candidatus Eremiobacteraeota bacterium]MCW5869936.1 DUF3341 domain-containing protein [Candidatus Eremiobacteraeota bacterium]
MSERSWLLQFPDQELLLEAVDRARETGLKVLDAYAPYPIEGLQQRVGGPVTRTSWLIFLAGLSGAALGFALCSWSAVWAYPFQIGGTPLFSWPAFLPITFECGVLLAALTAFVSVFAQAGLPRYHHPLFDFEAFRAASYNGFFLQVRGDYEAARQLGGVFHAE